MTTEAVETPAAGSQLAGREAQQRATSRAALPVRQPRGEHAHEMDLVSVVLTARSDAYPLPRTWTADRSTIATAVAALKAPTDPAAPDASAVAQPVVRYTPVPPAAASTDAPTDATADFSRNPNSATPRDADAPERTLPTRRSRREATARAATESRTLAGLFTRILTVRALGSQPTTSTRVAVVGELLRGAAAHGLPVLHRRDVPGQRGPVEYLAVGARGIYVIDVKHHKNAPIGLRTTPQGTTTAEDLLVDGTVMTSAVTATARRVGAVRSVLDDADLHTVPVVGVLCFVDGIFPHDVASIEVNGVHALHQNSLLRLVSAPGSLDEQGRLTLQEYLAQQLPAAH